MAFGFDLISDLNLEPDDSFDWAGKPTSLYCVIPGNISKDLPTVYRVLKHLGTLYRGVFFIDGVLENTDLSTKQRRNDELERFCSQFRNIIYLHNNVVIVDGVALLAINGWTTYHADLNIFDEIQVKCYRYEDISYFDHTLEKLQLHVDVKKIVVISNAVPLKELYFNEYHDEDDDMFPTHMLYKDTEHKVSHWVFGSYEKIVDMNINHINYLNNSKYDREPYYAKRVEVKI